MSFFQVVESRLMKFLKSVGDRLLFDEWCYFLEPEPPAPLAALEALDAALDGSDEPLPLSPPGLSVGALVGAISCTLLMFSQSHVFDGMVESWTFSSPPFIGGLVGALSFWWFE